MVVDPTAYYIPRISPEVYDPGFSRDFPPYIVHCAMCGKKGRTKLWPPTWLSDGPYVAFPRDWADYDDCGACPSPLYRQIFRKGLEVLACAFLGWLLLSIILTAYNIGLQRVGGH